MRRQKKNRGGMGTGRHWSSVPQHATTPDPLNAWLHEVQEKIEGGWYPYTTPGGNERIESPFGNHGFVCALDEDGDEYVLIGFANIQSQIYVEIEDGTYGRMQGFRIYTGRNEGNIEEEQETIPT